MNNRALLLILDGFGIGKDSPFNAIKNAKMPFYQEVLRHYPHSELITHGEEVGLPQGVMGNSEVGHMTMGAGRIIYQDLTRISKSIRDGDFFQNAILRKTIDHGIKTTGRVHLMGLLSDGGVHSHIDHLIALLDLCQAMKVPQICVHAFLDGRDTPPDSAPGYLKMLLSHPSFSSEQSQAPRATLTSLMGRFWAMDRDKRWDRVEKAYLTLTGQTKASPTLDPFQVIQKSYEEGMSDEFVEPTLFSPAHAMQNGDSVIFFNFRADRAREITHALIDNDFHEFDRKRGFQPSAFAGFTQYEKILEGRVAVAFEPQSFDHIFGEWLEEHQKKQFRIAETEKYAHVTFFFNGGREKPFINEDRVLVPSPKEVRTYDLKPEMSAFEVAREAVRRISEQTYDFILMNFANADMVGHTGNYEATIRAMEALDTCLEQVIGAAQTNGYHVLLTADHGNAEELRDSQGRIHTQHTLNPVPLLWIPPRNNPSNNPSNNLSKDTKMLLNNGSLADLMPTLCALMGLPIPSEATGKSLLPKDYSC